MILTDSTKLKWPEISEETNNSLSFLYVFLIRTDDKLELNGN